MPVPFLIRKSDTTEHLSSATLSGSTPSPVMPPSTYGVAALDKTDSPAVLHELLHEHAHNAVLQEHGHTFTLLEAAITAPAGLRVRGWSGQADSPEEQECDSVRLLACMHGQFIPVQVLTEEACQQEGSGGDRVVKVGGGVLS